MSSVEGRRQLGLAVVGVGGAVATTAIAEVEMLKRGGNRVDGLPLADVSVPGLTDYRDIVFGGWDLNDADLSEAAREHRVLQDEVLAEVANPLRAIRPWPAVGSDAFCRNVTGATCAWHPAIARRSPQSATTSAAFAKTPISTTW